MQYAPLTERQREVDNAVVRVKASKVLKGCLRGLAIGPAKPPSGSGPRVRRGRTVGLVAHTHTGTQEQANSSQLLSSAQCDGP